MGELIHSTIYLGKLAHLQAAIDQFIRHHAAEWEASNGNRLAIFKSRRPATSTQGSWEICTLGEGKRETAGIEAYEQPNGQTLVEFWDGYDPSAQQWWLNRPSIGDDLIEFVEAFTTAIGAGPAGGEDGNMPEPNRTILTKWHDGYTAKEIGKMVDLSPGTIGNIVTALRKRLGVDKVPYHR